MCIRVDLGNGNFAIACGGRGERRPKTCQFCRSGRPAALLCDWKTSGGATCDAAICKQCALHVADDKDLCPRHARAWEQWRLNHPDAAAKIADNQQLKLQMQPAGSPPAGS